MVAKIFTKKASLRWLYINYKLILVLILIVSFYPYERYKF